MSSFRAATWESSKISCAVWTGPTYFDPNVAGTRLTFYAAAKAYYSRDTGHYEGDSEVSSSDSVFC